MFDRFQGVLPKAIGEGTHFLIPFIQNPTIYDIRIRPKSITTVTGTRDLQQVGRNDIGPSLNFSRHTCALVSSHEFTSQFPSHLPSHLPSYLNLRRRTCAFPRTTSLLTSPLTST
jgi:hypothetical protein